MQECAGFRAELGSIPLGISGLDENVRKKTVERSECLMQLLAISGRFNPNFLPSLFTIFNQVAGKCIKHLVGDDKRGQGF
jgi:hypothetical protein